MNISFNGKFLSANATGVHRVAEELLREAHALVQDDRNKYAINAEIICPRNVKRTLGMTEFPQREAGLFTWQFWEQFDLPQLGRDRLLVSLCNLGPISTRRAITMIHDAQVFLTPESYSLPFRTWYQFALPMIGRRHLKVLTVSNYSRDELVRFGVAPREKIEVIHNGVDHILRIRADPAIVERLGLAPRRYACALANTQKHKNIPLLLRAFASPELADLRLVLVGGAGAEAFEKLGVEIPDNVVFAGRVSDGELRGLMEEALCYLCPSTTEGFGLPPLESMTLGVPAVVAPMGALPEICGDAALYADSDDASAWTRAIVGLSRDVARWSAYSKQGREQAAMFTWRKAAEKLLALLNDIDGAASVRENLTREYSGATQAETQQCAFAS